jgi:hypothetical protein
MWEALPRIAKQNAAHQEKWAGFISLQKQIQPEWE